MRTVSFSNSNVCNLLNQNFINTYSNLTGDPTAGKSISHLPDDPAGSCMRGNGNQNVQTLFMTSDGKIFHAVTGYISADDLVEEINFARDLYANIKESTGSAKEIVQRAHEERLAAEGAGTRQDLNVIGLPVEDSGNLFSAMIKRQIQADDNFSIRYPLMSYKDLEKDPTRLVGKGTTFFSSKRSGNQNGKLPPGILDIR